MPGKSGNKINWNRISRARRIQENGYEGIHGTRYGGGKFLQTVPKNIEAVCEAQDYLDDLQTLNARKPSLPKLKFMGEV